jgi:hypothetical protein
MHAEVRRFLAAAVTLLAIAPRASSAQATTKLEYDALGHLTRVSRSGSLTDPANCGPKGVVCPAPQSGSATCNAGVCGMACSASDRLVGSRCYSLRTDSSNCGWVGHVCGGVANGTMACVNGSCQPTCNAGYGLLGGTQCIPVTSDLNNCGSVGHVCAGVANATVACVDGSCKPTCNAGYGLLGGTQCIPVTSDLNNCGWVGHVCGGVANGTVACVNGSCQPTCNAGYGLLGGTQCIPVTSDLNNCGWVGHVCPNVANGYPKCTAGSCDFGCNAGYAASGSTCIPPPAAPTSLTAVAQSSFIVAVSWAPSTGATSYRLDRAVSTPTAFSTVYSSSATSFVDTGRTAGTSYFYRVQACNAAGCSPTSATVSAKTTSVQACSAQWTCPAKVSCECDAIGCGNATGGKITNGQCCCY